MFGALYNYVYLWLGIQSFKLKPSISTHSKPCMTSRTRLLKCFVLITLCCKTKHLRSLVWAIVRGFEWLEIVGLSSQKINRVHNLRIIFQPIFLSLKTSARNRKTGRNSAPLAERAKPKRPSKKLLKTFVFQLDGISKVVSFSVWSWIFYTWASCLLWFQYCSHLFFHKTNSDSTYSSKQIQSSWWY